jgi:hypothetical protein
MAKWALILFLPAVTIAQPAGSVVSTGTMSVDRMYHTATLLPDGRVLFAGAFRLAPASLPVANTAELYDPVRGATVPTGNMAAPHWGHTATVLPDGKVLIAGGLASQNSGEGYEFLSTVGRTAEIYDPATGTFTHTGNLNAPRASHAAVLLNSGKVLLVGGVNRGSDGPMAELYDPAQRTFSATGPLMADLPRVFATLLPDGKVLVGGAVPRRDFVTPYLALYDPETETFTPQSVPWSDDTYPCAGAVLPNGKVLLVVCAEEWYSNEAALFDPSSGSTARTANMNAALLSSVTAALLPNGRAMVTGRDDSMYKAGFDGSVQMYDSGTETFGTAVGTNHAEGFSSTVLQDGTVLIGAGWVCCGRSLNTNDIYRPDTLVPAPRLLGILHASTHVPVSENNPGVAGEALELYGSGLLDNSVIRPQVTIAGRMAEVLYFGKAPGLDQINVRVPAGANGAEAAVELRYIGRFSNTVTIALR